MTTIEDQVNEKIRRVARWKRENPGRSWSSTKQFANEPKIYLPVELLNSAAFRSLSRWAILVCLDLYKKRKMVSAGKVNGRRA